MAIRRDYVKRESRPKKTRQGAGRHTKFSHVKGKRYKKRSRGQG
jgi:hypothetical protein